MSLLSLVFLLVIASSTTISDSKNHKAEALQQKQLHENEQTYHDCHENVFTSIGMYAHSAALS